METKREVLSYLLKLLESGKPVLIVGLKDKRIPDLHNFYPKKYYETIRHLGFGFFEGRTEHGTFSFDAGGAMQHHRFDDGTWIAWSHLRVENREVLKDLGYDCGKVASALKEIIDKL